MSEQTYLYTYNIIEVENVDGAEIFTPITSYSSNASPPHLGSILVLTEFLQHNSREYKVVKALLIPRNSDDLKKFSDTPTFQYILRK